MPTTATVDLHDLRFLVRMLAEYSIESRAHRFLRTNPPKNRTIVKQYLAAHRAAIPQARRDLKPQYRELLNSLKTGQNMHRSLAIFVAREAGSIHELDA